MSPFQSVQHSSREIVQTLARCADTLKLIQSGAWLGVKATAALFAIKIAKPSVSASV